MTRSPGAIMPKSAIALPTEPRNRAARRPRVREDFASARFTSGIEAFAKVKSGRRLQAAATLVALLSRYFAST